MTATWGSSFYLFNQSLINDEIFYTVKDYIKQFKCRFSNDIDISMLDDYYMSSCDYDKFIVSEDSVSETIELRKIIKRYEFELGVDYIVQKKIKESGFSSILNPFKSESCIKMTPLAFKKVLLLSGNSIYMNYFIFLETVVQNYEEYQKLFNRKTLMEATQKIKLLERKIRKDSIRNDIKNTASDFNFDFSSDSS